MRKVKSPVGSALMLITVKVISIKLSEVGVGEVVVVVGSKRIIRLGVPVTYDTNSTANRVLDEKELFAICKQV